MISLGYAKGKIVLRKDRPNDLGQYLIQYQIYIQKKPVRIGLDLFVSPKKFDPKKQRVIGKTQAASDFNLLLEKAHAKANGILYDFRMRGIKPTPKDFREAWQNPDAHHNFLTFYRREIDRREARGEIESSTARQHRSSYESLRQFRKEISFADISVSMVLEFEQHLKRNGLKLGTISVKMKNFKAYLNLAIRSGIKRPNPFNEYKIRKGPRRMVYLDPEEFKLFEKYYEHSPIRETLKSSIRLFLFSCCTGMRLSDVLNFESSWIRRDKIVFIPQKTSKLEKQVEIPIGKKARLYLPTGVHCSEQRINDHIREAAKSLGIAKHLSFHCARHTFATLYLKQTKDIHSLKELLGHSKIDNTMIYSHVLDESKQKGIEAFDEI